MPVMDMKLCKNSRGFCIGKLNFLILYPNKAYYFKEYSRIGQLLIHTYNILQLLTQAKGWKM